MNTRSASEIGLMLFSLALGAWAFLVETTAEWMLWTAAGLFWLAGALMMLADYLSDRWE